MSNQPNLLSPDIRLHWAIRCDPAASARALATLWFAASLAVVAWMGLVTKEVTVRGSGILRAAVDSDAKGEISYELSIETTGRVTELNVAEGDVVHQGDILARLATDRIDIQLTQASRDIDLLESELAALHRRDVLATQLLGAQRDRADAELLEIGQDVTNAKSRRLLTVQLAAIELDRALDHRQRARTLKGVLSDEERNDTEFRWREADEELRIAKLPLNERQLETLRLSTVVLQRDFDLQRQDLQLRCLAKQREIESAKRDQALLELACKRAIVRAPRDGVVAKADLQLGDLVRPGLLGLVVVPPRGYQFETRILSKNIGQLKVGMPAHVTLDAFDRETYGVIEGTVASVSEDSDWVVGDARRKAAAYTVKIEVAAREIGRGNNRGVLKLGMTGESEVVIGAEPILTLVWRRAGEAVNLH